LKQVRSDPLLDVFGQHGTSRLHQLREREKKKKKKMDRKANQKKRRTGRRME
jgi:hypothetical protein